MIVTLTGGAASGKDCLAAKLRNACGAKIIEKVATFPEMEGPINDTYTSIAEEEFQTLLDAGDLFCHFKSLAGYRYAIRQTSIEAAFESPLSVGVFQLKELRQLRSYAAERGRERIIRSIYLDISDEEELNRRMRERGETEEKIQLRFGKARQGWSAIAGLAGIRFCVIDAMQSQEQVLAQVQSYISKDLRSHFFRSHWER